MITHTRPTDDLMGAAFVGFFAGMVLLAIHKMPNVNEALHYYKENDPMLFVAMRTCHILISLAMVMNTKYMIGWLVYTVGEFIMGHTALTN